MITCERCKASNLDGGQYCDECGAPLRPNSTVNRIRVEPGQNGSHSPAEMPQPEWRQAGAALNISSSGGAGDKPHAAWSSNAASPLGTVSAEFRRSKHRSLGCDGGVFPALISIRRSRGQGFAAARAHYFNDGKYCSKIWVQPTALSLIAASDFHRERVSRSTMAMRSLSGKLSCAST